MALVRESYLLRIASDPVARIWSGDGPLVIPADTVEAAPAEYLHGSHLLSVPDFQQLINGTAQRLEFRLSGVTDEMLRLALEDAPSAKGATAHIGRIDFDEDWQPIGPVEWEAVFRCDSLAVESNGSGGKRQRMITLSVGTEDTGRSFSPVSFWTDADQRRRSATDAIFSHVGNIRQGMTRRFGAK